MLNKVLKHNINYFTKNIDNYKKDYFDPDEEYLVNKYFKGKKTLILGCGAGRTLIPIFKKGFEVTGIDITPRMVAASQAKVKGLPIKIFKMDACNLKFPDNSFDNIFFPFHGIDYVYPNIYKAVLEARRVLKQSGVFIFSSHNRFHLKAMPRLFEGPYANYYGLITYRATPLDFLRLKGLFKSIKMIPISSISTNWKGISWKDLIYKILPIFDKSYYFICQGKK